MKRKGITIFRTICLAICFFIFTFGKYLFGITAKNIYLPIFACAYTENGVGTGICKLLVTPEQIMQTGGAVFAQLGSLALLVIFIVLLGRLWCGFACPFGFIQDVLTRIRNILRIPTIQVPEKIKPYLKSVKWLFLFLIIFIAGFCKWCPIRYVIIPFTGKANAMNILGIVITGIIIGICFIKERAFCRFCPLGTITGLFNKTCIGKIRKKGSACTHCRACLENCPMEIQGVYEEREKEDVVTSDCIYCMKCIEACPEKDALVFTMCGKKVLKSKRGEK